MLIISGPISGLISVDHVAGHVRLRGFRYAMRRDHQLVAIAIVEFHLVEVPTCCATLHRGGAAVGNLDESRGVQIRVAAND